MFTAASLACGLAPDPRSLIAFRFLQGAGAAFLIPQVFSLIQRHFDGSGRARALGRYAAVIAGGVVAGQILGGVIVDAEPVRYRLAAGVLDQRTDRHRTARSGCPAAAGRRRATAAAGSTLPGWSRCSAAVLAFMLPLVFGHEQGWPAWTWLSLGGSVVLFAVVRRGPAAGRSTR